MLKQVERISDFMGSTRDWAEAKSVIIGIPMDFTTSFRPGTRLGAAAVRGVSWGIEEYSPYQDRDLADLSYYDAGDMALPFGQVEESLKIIEQVTAEVLTAGKFPLFIGGEHLVSYPIIKEYARRYPDLAVIHFDAHADLREDYLGNPHSHATVMRKVAELIGPQNVYQFGIRSGTREEFAYGRAKTNFYPFQVLEPLQKVIPQLQNRSIYVTLDIDVVDPAFAPGTGTAEPGGISAAEMLAAIIALKELQVVGFDLVEIAPQYDQSERTALLGAKIVREALLAFTEK
ncbi:MULTISPECIES: agmatinase [unclassified Carboxydocella]|uniref:agmatinase n=1 Tax=unclassified Carboxydocella TaxID=2685367 RepID=UPI0009AEAD77|nr:MULTISPECIES: agmatinase [unclassified Carboxydocella]AVX30316.1 agmatinase [Carboxydocella thermautotrophica]GAW28733.1 agmatinase [Carboxydocella sp. ULO1]GAW30578.1 agmatinase [Carboxydocella sp. JDF658]